jgi:hypothetical protein
MPRTLQATALAALLAAPVAALSQVSASVERFPLHKPIPEPALTVCVSADVPIKLNELIAEEKGAEATKVFMAALHDGQCANARGVVTYTRQVHRVDTADGSVLTVYEANAGGATFYVPMLGFLHQDMTV